LQVKSTTRTGDLAKSFSVYVLPSTPGRLKSGALAPIASVRGCSSAARAAGAVSRRVNRPRSSGRGVVGALGMPGRVPQRPGGFTSL
jgi:hypothetical protein